MDFEFPNEEGKPYKSSGGAMEYNHELGKEIPKGWRVGRLVELIIEKRDRIKNDVNVLVCSVIKTGEIKPSNEFFNKKVYSNDISNYFKINKFDFAYNPARINIGSIGMYLEDMTGAVSPVYVVFSCKKGWHYFIEQILKLNFTKNQIKMFCSGTVRQVLDFNGFCNIKIIIPNDESLILKFNRFHEKLLSQLNQLERNSLTLSQIRDLLLPKLMTGKIRVPYQNINNKGG